MGVTDQSMISELLKRNYRDLFVDSIYQDTTLFDIIPKYSGDVRGEDVRHAVELTRSHGGGARTAGEFLPVDYPESFAQSNVSLKRWYYTLSIDGFAIELFKKGVGSFVDYLDLRMRNAQRDAANQLNRICHMDGTAVVAKCAAQTSKGSATGAVNGFALTHVWGYSFGATQFLEEGDSIVVVSSAGVAKGNARIENIDWDTQTVSFKDGVTLTSLATDLLVFGDSHSNSWNKEAEGLRKLVTATPRTVIQGINTNNRRWRSTVIDKTAAPVPYDWTHITRIVSASMYKGASGPQNVVLLMHPAMIEEHQRLVDPDIRYEATDFKLNKGLEVPVFNVLGKRVPVRTSLHMGFQEVLSINTDEIQRLELGSMDWDDRGGQVKNLQGKDAAYAYLKYYWAIAAKTLNHFARFDGIQVDTDYVKAIQETA